LICRNKYDDLVSLIITHYIVSTLSLDCAHGHKALDFECRTRTRQTSHSDCHIQYIQYSDWTNIELSGKCYGHELRSLIDWLIDWFIECCCRFRTSATIYEKLIVV